MKFKNLTLSLATVSLLAFSMGCQQADTSSDDQAAALVLLNLAAQSDSGSGTTTTTTCSTSSASPTAVSGGSVAASTYTIVAKNLCYFTFTNNSGSTNNFVFRNTVNSGDTDIAYHSTAFQSQPTNGSFWTSGTPCGDGSGWGVCVASTASNETISITNIPNNTTVYLAVWGFSTSSFSFSVTQN